MSQQTFSLVDWENNIEFDDQENSFFLQLDSQSTQMPTAQQNANKKFPKPTKTPTDKIILNLTKILTQIDSTDSLLSSYFSLLSQYSLPFSQLSSSRSHLISKISSMYLQTTSLISSQQNLLQLSEIIQQGLIQYQNTQKLAEEIGNIRPSLEEKNRYEGQLQRVYSQIIEGAFFFQANAQFKGSQEYLDKYLALKTQIVQITKFLFLKIFNKNYQDSMNIQINLTNLEPLFLEMKRDSLITEKLRNLLDFLQNQSQNDIEIETLLKDIFNQYFNYYRLELLQKFLTYLKKSKQNKFSDQFLPLNLYLQLELENYLQLFNHNKSVIPLRILPLQTDQTNLVIQYLNQQGNLSTVQGIIEDIGLVKEKCRDDGLAIKIRKMLENRLNQILQTYISDKLSLVNQNQNLHQQMFAKIDEVQKLLAEIKEVFDQEFLEKLRNQMVGIVVEQVKMTAERMEQRLESFLFLVQALSLIKQSNLSLTHIFSPFSYNPHKPSDQSFHPQSPTKISFSTRQPSNLPTKYPKSPIWIPNPFGISQKLFTPGFLC